MLRIRAEELPQHAAALRGASVVKFSGARLLRRRRGGGGEGCSSAGELEVYAGDLWVSRGRVIDPARRFWARGAGAAWGCEVEVCCGGALLSPGFIDVQCNGAYGVDFTDERLTPADIAAVLARMPASGVTALCPTLVSAGAATYRAVLRTVRERARALTRTFSRARMTPPRTLPPLPRAVCRL